jgi:hypothetical protein
MVKGIDFTGENSESKSSDDLNQAKTDVPDMLNETKQCCVYDPSKQTLVLKDLSKVKKVTYNPDIMTFFMGS